MSVYDIGRIALPEAPPEYQDDTSDRHFVPAPCQVACPVGTDAPSYIGYIWEEKWEEAFEAITATNPFSSICGRVCDAPCEPACRRVAADGALAIRNLKRVVMDRLGREHHLPPVAVTRSQTVGIVGAARSGTDAAKIIALGCVAVVYGVPIGLAAGGEIGAGEVRFSADFTDEDRRLGVVNILKAGASEASMMARCTGKTNLHNLEPEDLRALTLATAEATGIPLAGAR